MSNYLFLVSIKNVSLLFKSNKKRKPFPIHIHILFSVLTIWFFNLFKGTCNALPYNPNQEITTCPHKKAKMKSKSLFIFTIASFLNSYNVSSTSLGTFYT